MKMGAILGSAGVAVVLTKVDPSRACLASSTAVGCKCLLRGTNIQTAAGERKVEDLAVGDLLPAVFGGMRVPSDGSDAIRSRKERSFSALGEDALAGRLARSALAPDVQHADLYVTGEHALLVDGLLIP